MALTSRQKRPLDRSVPHQRDTRLIIIAAEGRETEKQYFAQFAERLNFAINFAKKLDTTPENRWPQSVGSHVYRVALSILSLVS